MGLIVTNLTNYLQRHLAENPQIFMEKMVGMAAELEPKGITMYNDIEDEMPLYELGVSDPGQPGNRASANYKASVLDWKNRILKVKNGEVSLKFTQAQIEALRKTHLNQMMMRRSNGDIYDIPFEQFMLDAVLKRLEDQIIRTLLWKGSLNASGTTTAAIADGFDIKLAADITATNIAASHVFAGAAINASNAIAQHKGVLDLIGTTDPHYLSRELICYTAPENMKFYNENYRADNGALPYNQQFQKTFLNDMPNIRMETQEGLAGDDRVVITTPGNLVVGTNAANAMNNIVVEQHLRDVYFLIDFKIGFEYKLTQEIWTNDQ